MVEFFLFVIVMLVCAAIAVEFGKTGDFMIGGFWLGLLLGPVGIAITQIIVRDPLKRVK